METRNTKDRGLVYSTAHGRMCPRCENPASQCRCKNEMAPTTGGGTVRVGRQTRGRKGKDVTTISGLPLDKTGLKAMCRQMKKGCGSGGTVKDGTIEIQGDHRKAVLEMLKGQGWAAQKDGR